MYATAAARRTIAACLTIAGVAACASSGTTASTAATVSIATRERPLPYPVLETDGFRRAVERGTRTRTGRPGPRYWTQYATYSIEAELEPATKRLTGRETVRYQNRSPDTLTRVAVHLYQNLFAPDAIRNTVVPVTNGMELSKVTAQGATLKRQESNQSGAGYVVDGTIAWLRPPRSVPPGGSIDLEFTWAFTVPPDGAPRSGTDGQIFHIAYWYPQVAVYDDVNGWQTDPYMGNSEFYMGYADYDVALTVPAGWLIGSTGELRNGAEVLSPQTMERLAHARRSRSIVRVVTTSDRVPGLSTAPGRNGKLTWRFQARNVRDFAFGTSDKYLWDATIALTGDSNEDRRPDTASINTFYRPERISWAWDESARYGQHSIEFLSRYLWPYGYPQMTSVDGPVSCSGMEYPMITCIGGERDTLRLYSVTVHEYGHMWFPMQVGSDEKRYAWQDEGLTRFNQAQAMREFFKGGYDLERIARDSYIELARTDDDVELMRHGDLYPPTTNAYAVVSYQKMASVLVALRALLGEETFLKAYREYGRRWINKHPTPYDMWNTFNEVAGRDLSWFWRSWFDETWTLDHAVASVTQSGDRTEIAVEDRGLVPMPVRLAITRADGTVERTEVPVDIWLHGARRHVLRVSASPQVTRVEIDPEEAFPDVDRANNRWGK